MTADVPDSGPAAVPGADLRRENAAFFRTMREQADRVAVLGPQLAARRPEPAGVTQGEVAGALRARGHRVSVGWMQKLESGTARWTEPVAAAYCAVMRLPPDAAALFIAIARVYAPPQQQSYDVVADANQLHLDSLRDTPAYIEDDAWQIRQTNAAAREVLPSLAAGANSMVWALTNPAAHTQLVDWETAWAPRMVAELRLTLLIARNDGDVDRVARIQTVLDTCCLSAQVRRLWEQDRAVHLDAMGEVRRIDVPATGLVTVRLWTAGPVGRTGWRMVCLHRVD